MGKCFLNIIPEVESLSKFDTNLTGKEIINLHSNTQTSSWQKASYNEKIWGREKEIQLIQKMLLQIDKTESNRKWARNLDYTENNMEMALKHLIRLSVLVVINFLPYKVNNMRTVLSKYNCI